LNKAREVATGCIHVSEMCLIGRGKHQNANEKQDSLDVSTVCVARGACASRIRSRAEQVRVKRKESAGPLSCVLPWTWVCPARLQWTGRPGCPKRPVKEVVASEQTGVHASPIDLARRVDKTEHGCLLMECHCGLGLLCACVCCVWTRNEMSCF
jgi:hypothetical protein